MNLWATVIVSPFLGRQVGASVVRLASLETKGGDLHGKRTYLTPRKVGQLGPTSPGGSFVPLHGVKT